MTERLDKTDMHDRMRVALDAEVDVRTLERAIAGEKIKPLSRRRIVRTLAARGLKWLPEQR